MVMERPSEKDSVMRDLSEITVNALKDLALARKDLQENDLHMKEMNKLANERVDEMSRVNQQLQTKISFVENIATIITSKNVIIRFEDSGVGVPPGDELNIFDPMFTTKSYGGGLGLTICKMIIEQHGGKLLYSSMPSIFSVSLPKT